MRVLIFFLLALVSFSKTNDLATQNLRLKKTNAVLLKTLQSLTQEQDTAKEEALGAGTEKAVGMDKTLKYTHMNIHGGYTDAWIRDNGDNTVTVGISPSSFFLGEVVFVELPEVGDEVNAGELLSFVESVSLARELNSPVTGEIVEVNKELPEMPELITEEPYDDGWIAKIRLSDPSEMDGLLDYDEYLNVPDTDAERERALSLRRRRSRSAKEKAVGAVSPDECWYHDGYEEDCPEPCVWTHFSRGDGMCNAPDGTLPNGTGRSQSEEKAVGAVYHRYATKTWCRDEARIYDSLRSTPHVTYEECKLKCEEAPTCNYFLHGKRVMDGRMNRCVTWYSCDYTARYNDGSPTVYEREVWRSPMEGMSEEDIRDATILIG